MKKFTGFLIVLSLFVLGSLKAEAAVNPNTPCASNASPSITILSPNGGEIYNVSNEMKITWKTCNLGSSSETIKIGFDLITVDNEGGAANTFLISRKGLLNDGLETVIIPSNVPTASNYKIRMYSYDPANTVNGGGRYYKVDQSDNVFTIKTLSAEVATKITVLSPNGGETYTAGQKIEVRWKTKNISGNISEINLMSINGWGGGEGVTFDKDLKNDGHEIVTLPDASSFIAANAPFGKYFKIEVNATDNNGIMRSDFSDDTFTIKDSINNSDFKVLSPNGGETFQVGQPINISLNGGLYMTRVGLVYPDFDPYKEINDGNDVHWLSVTSAAGVSFVWDGVTFIDNDGNINPFSTGSGQYKIVAIKDVNENKCYLKKISNCVFDLSDSAFTLTEGGDIPTTGKITLLSPQSGSIITVGSKVEVKWKSQNLPPRHGNTLKMIIKRNGVLVREFRTEDDGNEIVTIPLGTPNGQYQLEYGTISPSSGGGDHFVKYGSANFTVVSQLNSINCKIGELYSSTTGQKCSTPIELEQKCDPATDCYKNETPIVTTQTCNSPIGCLNTSSQLTRTLKIGVKGEDVKYIQTLLGITADGSYGPVTASKVKEWQASKQLKVDGIFGPKSMSIISQ